VAALARSGNCRLKDSALRWLGFAVMLRDSGQRLVAGIQYSRALIRDALLVLNALEYRVARSCRADKSCAASKFFLRYFLEEDLSGSSA
jgi:hypothetical protein